MSRDPPLGISKRWTTGIHQKVPESTSSLESQSFDHRWFHRYGQACETLIDQDGLAVTMLVLST